MSKPCWVYTAIPMTGYDKQTRIQLSLKAKNVLEQHGLKVWNPVLHENVEGAGNIENDKQTLDWKWIELDKPALNSCFVFLNLDADSKSFGVEHEQGRQRFSEWQPTILISPKHAAGYISIANYEDDLIVPDIETAAREIQKRWGSWGKRVRWKLGIFRHIPKWAWRQLKRLFQ